MTRAVAVAVVLAGGTVGLGALLGALAAGLAVLVGVGR